MAQDPVKLESRGPLASVRSKLALAFTAIVVLFLFALLASERGIEALNAETRELHDVTVPRVLSFQEVAGGIRTLAITSASVQNQQDLDSLDQLVRDFESDLSMSRAALLRVGEDRLDLSPVVDQLESNFDAIQSMQRTRLAITARRDSQAGTSAEVAGELVEELDGERIRREYDGAGVAAIGELRLGLMGIKNHVQRTRDLESLEALNRLQQEFRVDTRAAVRLVAELEDPMRARASSLLDDLMELATRRDGLFELTRTAIQSRDSIQERLRANENLASLLAERSSALTASVQSEVRRSQARADSASRQSRFSVRLFWISALILSILIVVLYVQGRVVHRLDQLVGDLTRLSEGDLEVEVRGGGDRELAQIADAAEVFRTNARNLTTALDVLEQRNASLIEFAHVASHDLKSPMRAIANLSQWVREDCEGILPEGSVRHLELMQERVERMEDLLEDLLRYSRLGNDTRIFEPTNLGELVEDVLGILDPEPNVQISVVGGEQDIHTIQAPLKLVLRNLVQNAINHHDREDMHIRVEMGDPAGGFIQIAVVDDGPGIPPDQREDAFRLFRKLNLESSGTGMGLALVRRAAELMGGQVHLEGAEPRGTCVVIRWPVDAPVTPESAEGPNA